MTTAFAFPTTAAWLLLALAPWQALAHEGHDHEEPPAAPVTTTGRVATELSSELYEVVIESHGDHLDIWLDRYDSNAPVSGATLTVSLGDAAGRAAREEAPGQYVVDIDPLAPGSSVALTLVVSGAAGDDLLGGTLDVPADAAAVTGGTRLSTRSGWAMAGLTALLVLVLLVARRRRRDAARLAAALGVGATLALAPTSPASAHEGHDHAEPASPAPVAVGSRPARLPDGSVFVPKATQRILEVRTEIARAAAAPVSVRLIGEIVGDPRASAEVQTLQGGRVEPAGERWLPLGATVKRGEILLRLTPAGSGAERAGSAAELARVDAELAQARRELLRLRDLDGVVSRTEIETAATRERSLVSQRAALAATARGGEVLRAPIAGVIAALDVRPGQVVEPGRTLIMLVDPARLGVEALAFDPIDTRAIAAASVTLRDGRSVRARLEGVGAQLAGGARSVRLSLIEAAPGLAIGQPVTAWLERKTEDQALVLPLEALARLPNGETVVFEKTSAERFVPRSVRYRQVAADRIAVLAGIEPADRVVTRGAALLTQIR